MSFLPAVRAKYNITANEDKPLYHVTYLKNLSDIASSGLVPGSGGSLGQGAGYQEHSSGKTFLTEESGVSFWYSKGEAWADHNSDNPYDDELIPVVLRTTFTQSELEDADIRLEADKLGSRDAAADAFYTEDTIVPNDLELWNGSSWVHVDAHVDPDIAMEYEEDPDDPSDGWWVFRSDNPLMPF